MDNERRLEILGILIITLSIFLLVSLAGYNPNEESTISPNILIENPMGMFGLVISDLFIKYGFGYTTLMLPFLGFVWGWFLFSKRSLQVLFKITKFALILMILVSFNIGVLIQFFYKDNINYLHSGLIGANLADLFIDLFSIWGTLVFILASYLVLFRGYFNINYLSLYWFFLRANL